jgi:hypothetical protein
VEKRRKKERKKKKGTFSDQIHPVSDEYMDRKYAIHQNRAHSGFCVLCISSSDCMFHYYTIFLRISGGEGLALSNVF